TGQAALGPVRQLPRADVTPGPGILDHELSEESQRAHGSGPPLDHRPPGYDDGPGISPGQLTRSTDDLAESPGFHPISLTTFTHAFRDSVLSPRSRLALHLRLSNQAAADLRRLQPRRNS